MITPGTSASKLIAVLLLLTTIAVLFSLVDSFYIQRLINNAQKIEQLERLNGDYKKRTTDLESLEGHFTAYQKVGSGIKLFLEDEKESVVIAKLQGKLKSYIQSSRAVLDSSQVIASSSKERFKPLTLRLHFKSSPQRFRAILYAIESQYPVLFVQNISIKPTTPDSPQSPQELNVRMDVVGYLKKQGLGS